MKTNNQERPQHMKTNKQITARLPLTETVKAAWIREEGYPVGTPAPGFFRCSCGEKVPCAEYGQAENVTCRQCATTYNGHGWIVGTYERPIRYEHIKANDPDRRAKLATQRAQFGKDAQAGKVLCITDLLISTGM